MNLSSACQDEVFAGSILSGSRVLVWAKCLSFCDSCSSVDRPSQRERKKIVCVNTCCRTYVPVTNWSYIRKLCWLWHVGSCVISGLFYGLVGTVLSVRVNFFAGQRTAMPVELHPCQECFASIIYWYFYTCKVLWVEIAWDSINVLYS